MMQSKRPHQSRQLRVAREAELDGHLRERPVEDAEVVAEGEGAHGRDRRRQEHWLQRCRLRTAAACISVFTTDRSAGSTPLHRVMLQT